MPDMTGRSRAGDRSSLDASRSRRLAGLAMLHRKFIDDEVVVTIPPKWYLQSTKASINEKLGDGVFESHGNFNANNPLRMRIAWSVKDVTAIFAKVDKEYRAAMDKYTMGTGGGPGAEENFAAWQDRDETNVVTYSPGSQPSLIYLSVVHMWDKEYSFPFVTVRDSMPDNCSIDEEIDFGGGDNLSTPTDGESRGTLARSTSRARSSSSRGGHSSLSRMERGLESAMMGFSDATKEASSATREMISIVRPILASNTGGNGGASGGVSQLMPHQLTEHISRTEELITNYNRVTKN